jgi:predicted SAM-dependent methyltransferase
MKRVSDWLMMIEALLGAVMHQSQYDNRKKAGDCVGALRLHLGCGLVTPDGWINTDGSLNARLASTPVVRRTLGALRLIPERSASAQWSSSVKYLDVRKRLPYDDRTILHIYASHLLEHLYYDEATNLLRECRRVLKPGGVIRVVVPDLRTIVNDYLGEQVFDHLPAELKNVPNADRMNLRLLMHPKSNHQNLVYRLYYALGDFHSHKWMYDAESLEAQFRHVGFDAPMLRPPFQSNIPDIAHVEVAGRVLGGEGICMEATLD